MKHFISGKTIAIDTETTGLRPWQGDRPFAFSFCNKKMETWYCEFPVDPRTRKVYIGPNTNKKTVAAYVDIKRLMEDPKIVKVFHHASFDVRMFDMIGIKVTGKIHDTMFAAHICNTLEESLGLKELALKYGKFPTDDQIELRKIVVSCRSKVKKLGWKLACKESKKVDGTIIRKGMIDADYWIPATLYKHHPKEINEERSRVCRRYCIKDAVRTMLLHLFYEELLKELELTEIYNREIKLRHVVYDIESAGLCIDIGRLLHCLKKAKKLSKKNKERVLNCAKYHQMDDFNLNSPQQLATLLYDVLNLKCLSFTEKTKARQTSAEALRPYKEHKIVRALGKYKANTKAYNTFFVNWLDDMIPEFGHTHLGSPVGQFFIHSNFNQLGAKTGRFSSSGPNLQNISDSENTKSDYPIQARFPFGPRWKHRWYLFDWQQLEMVIFTDVSKEKEMEKYILTGGDIHSQCANRAWGGNTIAAIKTAITLLELDGTGSHYNEHVRRQWNRLGILPKHIKKLSQKEKFKFASEWLAHYNYDIVVVENLVGKKTVRVRAKSVNFSKIYGGGPKAIMSTLGCSYSDAKQFLMDYDVAFPRIQKYMSELTNEALSKGHVRTKFGRPINIDPNFPYRCVNYKVQGTAVDFLKFAMTKICQYLKEEKIDGEMVMILHDEIFVSLHEKFWKTNIITRIAELMSDSEGYIRLPTPVKVERCRVSWNVTEVVKKVGNNGIVVA